MNILAHFYRNIDIIDNDDSSTLKNITKFCIGILTRSTLEMLHIIFEHLYHKVMAINLR